MNKDFKKKIKFFNLENRDKYKNIERIYANLINIIGIMAKLGMVVILENA